MTTTTTTASALASATTAATAAADAAAPLAAATGDRSDVVRASGSGRGARHIHSLLRWLARTALIVVPVFFVSTLITFLLGAASGLNPAAAVAGDSATPALIAQLNLKFGLNKPIVVQYFDWMGGIFRGNLGVSWFSGIPVNQLIEQRVAISASVAGFALLIGLVIGPILGTVAAVHQGRFVDRFVTAFTTLISTLPPFVVSIGLILVLSVWLKLLPSGGYVPFSQNPAQWLAMITMPAIALSLELVADIARQLRTGLVLTLRENYITGAIVRGLSYRRVLAVHAFRNGCGPALAVVGLRIPTLIGGAVLTETIFNMQGFSVLSSSSALRGDVPVVLGTLVVAIVFVLFVNVVVNALQGVLLPMSRRGR